MNRINEYFPSLSQKKQFLLKELYPLFEDWNKKINVVSRKDIPNLFERHILHSLAIAKYIHFAPETKILDFGTGGGFPGLPLAILFPDSVFHLVDSIGKKIKVVDSIVTSLGIENVFTHHSRAEDLNEKYDFVVCRAVNKLCVLVDWVQDKICTEHKNEIPNGLIAMKGGNVSEEVSNLGARSVDIVSIKSYFCEGYFSEKYLVFVPLP